MCTYATERVAMRGSGKSAGEWAALTSASVYVDHPYVTQLEHTLNIDLFAESECRSRPIALELSLESAEALIAAISRAVSAARQAGIELQRAAVGATAAGD